MYGKAKGLKVKYFGDYTDGSVEEKLNVFFTENPEIEVVDVKFEYRPNEQYQYGHEFALVFYRENNKKQKASEWINKNQL